MENSEWKQRKPQQKGAMTKSANMRVALLPYPVIAAAVGGNPDAIARVIRHYSSYIAALSMRTTPLLEI